MDFGGNLVDVVSQGLARKHIVEALFVSTVMLLVYDWLLMLSKEVKYVWRSSWNYTKVLYLLARYTPFAAMALMCRNQLAFDASPESCQKAVRAACWISFVGVDVTEIIIFIRTYAVWNKDKRVGIGLALLWMAVQIPTGILAERFLDSLDFIQNPYPDIFRGCLALSATKVIYSSWVMFILMEGVVLALMVTSALRTYRKNTSTFMNVIYVDGIRFSLYMFCVTLVNVITTIYLPIDFISIGSCLEIVLHSILACRLVIGLREASKSPGRISDAFELSDMPNEGTVVFARTHRRVLSNDSSWVDVEAPGGSSQP